MRIDLDELIAGYETGLIDKLRRFGVEGELFETWVPDPNPVKSITNLMDASREAGLPANFIITVSRALLDTVDLKSLRSELEEIAHLSITDRSDSVIIYLSELEDLGDVRSSSDQGQKTPPSAMGVHRHDRRRISRAVPQTQGDSTTVTNKHRLLNNTLYDLLEDDPLSHEGSIKRDQESCVVVAQESGCFIELQINTSSHVVEKMVYNGAFSEGVRPLINRLCQFSENRPIQDMSDHAVARLEFEVRGIRSRPVPGIVIPHAVDYRFARLQALLRQALAKYRAATEYWEMSNTFDEGAQNTWVQLSGVEKRKKAQEILRIEAEKIGFDATEIDVIDVEYDVRVLAKFSGSLARPETDKQPIMMQLERALVDYLDPRLELFLEPAQDKSSLRRLSGED